MTIDAMTTAAVTADTVTDDIWPTAVVADDDGP